MESNLSLKWRFRYWIWRKIGELGNYCNECPGDLYAYRWYRFLCRLFF